MSAPLWVCLVLLMVTACTGRPNWPSGDAEKKFLELPQQRPIQVPKYLLEAQAGVNRLIAGAREDALEHLTAAKHKQSELRQQFLNALEHRLFRLELLKPQPILNQKPCTGSIIHCFHIPRKPYVPRPLHNPSYTKNENTCNHLPHNTYIYQECIKLAQHSTHATVRPTQMYPLTTINSLVRITSDSGESTKNTPQTIQKGNFLSSSTADLAYIKSLSPTKRTEIVQKLDSQKTNTQLENEILGIKEKSFTLEKLNTTSTKSNIENETESVVSEYDSNFGDVDSRIEPPILSVEENEYSSTTTTSSSPSSKFTDLEGTHSIEENVTRKDDKVSSHPLLVTSTFYPYVISTNIYNNFETKQLNSSENGNLAGNKEIEVNNGYTSLPTESDSKKFYTSSELAVQNEFDITTQEAVSKMKESNVSEDATLSPEDSYTNKDILESDLVQESKTLNTLTHNDELNSSTPPTTHFNTPEEKFMVQTSSELSQTEIQYTREIDLNHVVHEESTSVSSLSEDVGLKSLTTVHMENTYDNDDARFPGESSTYTSEFSTDYSTSKEKNIVDATTIDYKKEDQSTIYEPVYEERTLLYSSRTEYTTQPTTVFNEYSDIVRNFDGIELTEEAKLPNPTVGYKESTLDSTTTDDETYIESRTVDELIVDTTEHVDVRVESTNEVFDKPSNISDHIASSSLSTPTTTQTNDNSQSSSVTPKAAPSGILKFTNEIESTSANVIITETEIASTPPGIALNDGPDMLEAVKELRVHREKRSEEKPIVNLEDSKGETNSSDIYLSPTEYASAILELLPVIREGYKNNAFNDEDKEAIRSIFGDMKWMDEESLKNIKESAKELLMGDETQRTADELEEYVEYDSSESHEEMPAENERREKRSKSLQVLSNLVGHLPKNLQRELKQETSQHLQRRTRKIRSSGNQQVPEAAAILALLAENSEGVQLDRADDDDDDEYEYYEDDEDEDYMESYEDDYEEEEEPSISELIKLARKHRVRKAMHKE